MVETPFFSKETVDKEKGIIAEEIKDVSGTTWL